MTTSLKSMSELRALRDRLSRLPEVNARIAVRGATLFSDLAQQDFDRREGVAGTTWPSGITLNKTGALRRLAIRYEAIGTKIRASVTAVRYAKYQLKYGFLPRVIPAEWSERLKQIADEELAAAMRGR